MSKALEDAVASIKAAGFSHIKVELEGDIGRDGERECNDCYGDGRVDCSYCEGEGYVGSGSYTRQSGEEVLEECGDCYGDGRVECDECNGSGNFGNFMEEDDCETFMRDWVRDHHPEALDHLTYGRFYEDGSVDSEFTFTVPMDNVADVPIWMNAFAALADEAGELDVSGAGLHIALLHQSGGGDYPLDQGTLDRAGVENFESEVTKLLPALFFLASAGHQSRDLGYRHARIGADKYNAVSHHDRSCFEFRVFETCYQRPEAFFDYVQTIANCIKFYADPTLKVKELGRKFGFNDGNEVARFYDTPEQLRILNATVKHLKPADKTYKKLKEERGVRYTIKSLAQREKTRMAQLRNDYREYRRHWIEARRRPLNERQLEEINYYMTREGFDRERAEAAVRGDYDNNGLMTLAQFVDSTIRNRYDEVVAV